MAVRWWNVKRSPTILHPPARDPGYINMTCFLWCMVHPIEKSVPSNGKQFSAFQDAEMSNYNTRLDRLLIGVLKVSSISAIFMSNALQGATTYSHSQPTVPH